MNTCAAMVILSLIGSTFSASVLRGTRTWDCGPEDKVVIFGQTSLYPSPVVYPGNVSIASHMQLLEDLPTENLKVRVELEKLEPERMAVPCMNGRGSW